MQSTHSLVEIHNTQIQDFDESHVHYSLYCWNALCIIKAKLKKIGELSQKKALKETYFREHRYTKINAF